MSVALSVREISKSFGQTDVLKQVSLDMQAGEFVSLLGPSGCGKSTLLRIIAGFEAQSSGQIHLGGVCVDNVAPRDRELAMVFQSYALYPHMTVGENIATPLELRRLKTLQRLPLIGRFTAGSAAVRSQITRDVEDIARLAEIDKLLDRRPAALSGGQRQRVALARAMVRKPGLFLLDEPLSNLDAKLRIAMRAELVSLNRETGSSMVYVTHDQTEAMTMSDRIALMQNGVILQYDSPEAIYSRPACLAVAVFVGQPTINCFVLTLNKRQLEFDDGSLHGFSYGPIEGPVTLAVRPEAFVPGRQRDETAAVSVSVQLQRSERLGAEVLLWCETNSGESVVCQLRAADFEDMRMRGLFNASFYLNAANAGVHLFAGNQQRAVSLVFRTLEHAA